MNSASCPKHPDQKISLIYIGKDKILLLCEYCLDKNMLKQISPIQTLPLSINKLLKQPEHILEYLDLGHKIQNFFQQQLSVDEIQNKLNQLEKLMKSVQDKIQQWMENIKLQVKKLNEIRQNLNQDLLKTINIEEFTKILQNLMEQGKETINPDAIEQIQEKLNKHLQNLTQNDQYDMKIKLKSLISNALIKVQNEKMQNNQFKEISQNIDQFQKIQYELEDLIIPKFVLLESNILTNEKFMNKLKNIIQDRTKKQIVDSKLIYLGSKDGLNGQAFRDKVNEKSNLLLIFQSKSKYVFGSFSPCQWKNNANWVKDETNQSFIFSETHDEIYPIIESQNQHALYCGQNYGPWISGNGNIGIYNDFQTGQCYLGNTYKWDKYNNGATDYLYGSATPNIVECEIFELIFI